MITLEQVTEAILEGIDNVHDMDVTHQDYAESAAKLVMELIAAEVARLTAEREALGKACREWSETSQANYQRAKRAEQLLSDIGETVTARDAAQVPEVKALIDALKETAAILQACLNTGKLRNGDSYRIGGVYLQTVSDALDSADTALRAIAEPKTLTQGDCLERGK